MIFNTLILAIRLPRYYLLIFQHIVFMYYNYLYILEHHLCSENLVKVYLFEMLLN